MVEVVKRIRERMKHAQDQQKSYAKQKWCELEFNVRDEVFV